MGKDLKIVSIMQPYFLPYIGYWQLINISDEFVILNDVNYKNKSWINRNKILEKNQSKLITLPLNKASQNKKINEILIFGQKEKCFDIISKSYYRAPYYKDVIRVIEKIIMNDEINLSSYLVNSIQLIKEFLRLKTNISLSVDFKNSNNLSGEEKIINICKSVNADEYLNVLSGSNLYKKNNFMDNKIKLKFLDTKIKPYNQNIKNFVPYLSIVDLLMFLPKDLIKIHLNNFKIF